MALFSLLQPSSGLMSSKDRPTQALAMRPAKRAGSRELTEVHVMLSTFRRGRARSCDRRLRMRPNLGSGVRRADPAACQCKDTVDVDHDGEGIAVVWAQRLVMSEPRSWADARSVYVTRLSHAQIGDRTDVIAGSLICDCFSLVSAR